MPEVIVEAEQSLALGARPRAGAPAPTHLHVPGPVLRGALATVWLNQHGLTKPGTALRTEFVRLFEKDVRFGPLFAEGSGVVPLSVLRCKYQPQSDCVALAVDGAYNEVAEACPHCDGPMSQGRGTVEWLGNAPTVRNTRVQLTDDGVAADGQLHTRDALSPRLDDGRPLRFTGRLIGGEGSWLIGEHTLWMGGRRTTTGQVRYNAVEDDAAAIVEPMVPEGRRLVLRLASPAVLVDQAGRPCKWPDEQRLGELLGVKVEVDRAWTRWERIGGWHAAVDLPKPEEYAVCAGSTYVLTLSDEPDPTALRRLIDMGIGLRRAEGFGWLEIGQGAWRPSAMPMPPAPPKEDSIVVGMAELLANLDGNLPRWFIRELRDYLRYLTDGGRPHTDLLRRRRLDSLPAHTRKLVSGMLHKGDPRLIADIMTELEVRIRKARS